LVQLVDHLHQMAFGNTVAVGNGLNRGQPFGIGS